MPRNQSYDDALARIYRAYIEAPLKRDPETAQYGGVTEPTLEAIIERSPMGRQNAHIKALLKDYVVSNKTELVAIPTATAEKTMLFETKRKKHAIRVGQLKARRKRGDSYDYARLQAEARALRNYIRLQPFTAFFDAGEVKRIEGLPYSVSRPHVRKDGVLTVEYRKRRISKSTLLTMRP